MGMLRKMASGLPALFRKEKAERELDEELREYFVRSVAEKMKAGMSREQASREARMEMGSLDAVKEEVRDASWESAVESFWRDLRYGWRMLGKNPGGTCMATAVLAIAIGVNATTFSIFNSIILRPLPVKDPNQVVNLYRTVRGESRSGVFSYPEFLTFRDHNTVFTAVVAYAGARMRLSPANGGSPAGEIEQVHGQMVSGNYFDVLGAAPVLGRTFSPEEDLEPGTHPVAVLSYGFWQRRFGADPGLVGRTITLNSLPYTVIGVASRGFVGTDPDAPDLWVPLMMYSNVRLDPNAQRVFQSRDAGWLRIVARLKPGVRIEQAQAELAVLAKRFNEGATDERSRSATVTLIRGSLLSPEESGDFVSVAALVMGVVGMLLLIACANVANLQLARGTARQRELGIRVSLGATRGRLVRQLLVESSLLAALAGGVGFILSYWAADLLIAAVHPPGQAGLRLDVSPDWRVLTYTLGIALMSGITFGLLPALRVSRHSPTAALRGDWGNSGGVSSGSRLRGALIVSQVAGSLFLLVTAGLLVRALERAQTIDPGFELKNVLVVSLDLRQRGDDDSLSEEYHRKLSDRIRAMPGVQSVAMGRTIPLGTSFTQVSFLPEGLEVPAGQPLPGVNFNIVSPGYFDTLQIPLQKGRAFTAQDVPSAPRVAMISAAVARVYWPGQDPIGKRFKQGRNSEDYRVVGVTRDIRNVYLWAADTPYVYFPYAQASPEDKLRRTLFVKATGNSSALMASLPGVVRELDSSLPVTIRSLQDNLANWTWPSQIGAAVSAGLGMIALLLATMGIFGVTSYVVRQRTREIGIRMALGAQPRDVLKLFLRQGGGRIALGLLIGLGASWAASRLFARFLFGLSAMDAVTFVGASVLLALAAVAACWIPARRATRVDPLIALGYE
jgi:predicted permease